MKLSVVILNYNVRYFLEQCIKSVLRATAGIDSEIIVIDNASADDSCEMVRTMFPEVILLQNSENVGFSKANNQAVETAQGEYVCIINPDTAVAEDTFRKCLAYAETIKNLGALGVRLIDGTGHFLPESKRNLPTPRASMLKLLGLTSRKKGYYARQINDDEFGEVPVLVGAFMFLKREVYNKIEGFDEDYFMYGEDIDFSYKLTKAGLTNHYMGTADVLHYKGESTQRNSDYYKRFYGAMKIFYRKHFHSNWALNTLVNVGVTVARVFGSTNGYRKRTSIAQRACILTEDFSLLKVVSDKMDLPVQSVPKTIFEEGYKQNTLFVFDVRYMNYSQILSVMKKFKGNGNSFRIIPPGSRFMIGSDKSDEKGEVFVF